MKTNTIFETGATSAAVNELILYTDNTRELAEWRDCIYNDFFNHETLMNAVQMMPLLDRAETMYEKEMGHPIAMTSSQDLQYCHIYANRFADWKREKELNNQLK